MISSYFCHLVSVHGNIRLMTVWFEQQGVLLLFIAFILPAAAPFRGSPNKGRDLFCHSDMADGSSGALVRLAGEQLTYVRNATIHCDGMRKSWYRKCLFVLFRTLSHFIWLAAFCWFEGIKVTHSSLSAHFPTNCCFQLPSPSFLPWSQFYKVSPGLCQNFTPFSIFSLHHLFLAVHRL